MITNIDAFLAELNEKPNAADGFGASDFYSIGRKHGLTCTEIAKNFLGKDKAITRGKYPAVKPETLWESANPKATKPTKVKAEPRKKKETVRTAKNPVIVDKTTTVDLGTVKITAADKEARKALIASIAKRHASEDAEIAKLSRSEKTRETSTDDAVAEEFDRLQKTYTVNPSLA